MGVDIVIPHFVRDAKAFATHPSHRTTIIQILIEDKDLVYFLTNICRANFIEVDLFC